MIYKAALEKQTLDFGRSQEMRIANMMSLMFLLVESDELLLGYS